MAKGKNVRGFAVIDSHTGFPIEFFNSKEAAERRLILSAAEFQNAYVAPVTVTVWAVD